MHYFWSELPTSSTSCKTMETFKFAHHHVDYHYLMRMGDDAYMNPEKCSMNWIHTGNLLGH
jgi:hypothetical protein